MDLDSDIVNIYYDCDVIKRTVDMYCLIYINIDIFIYASTFLYVCVFRPGPNPGPEHPISIFSPYLQPSLDMCMHKM